jgi:hypothetical protein
MDVSEVEAQVRAICLGLPEVTERLSHGTPAFFVRKQFMMIWPEGHHDAHFPQLWCAAPPGAQDALVAEQPDLYFRPPYVGTRGWLGVRLGVPVEVDELRAICEEAWRTVAPPTLVARQDATGPG